ncbi:MAG TPA: YrdB family protein [Gemmatimonadota bacterium]|nr:YrdB family protein [Gemmatimonadota bacterium]
MSTALARLNLTLRALVETGVVAGLAYWGWHAGRTPAVRIVLAASAPLVGFGFWGLVDFRGAGRLAEPLRLVQELAVSLLAAAGLWAAGAPRLAWALAGLTVVHHALVYALGQRLL